MVPLKNLFLFVTGTQGKDKLLLLYTNEFSVIKVKPGHLLVCKVQSCILFDVLSMCCLFITLSQDSLLDFFHHGKSSCRICSCRFSKCVCGKILHWYTCNYGNETSWIICVYIKYSLIDYFTPYSKTHVSLIKCLLSVIDVVENLLVFAF